MKVLCNEEREQLNEAERECMEYLKRQKPIGYDETVGVASQFMFGRLYEEKSDMPYLNVFGRVVAIAERWTFGAKRRREA